MFGRIEYMKMGFACQGNWQTVEVEDFQRTPPPAPHSASHSAPSSLQAENEDEQRLRLEKNFRRHRGSDTHRKEDGHNVDQFVLSRIGKTRDHAAFPKQVTKHEHPHQRRRVRGQHAHNEGRYDSESDFLELARLRDGS